MKQLESSHIIKLDALEISRENCTIKSGDHEIKVSPRSMDVLIYLVEHSGRVISPEELLDQFWSSLASDHAVHKAIAELRAAMGDSVRQQRHIKTVPKRGYKLLTNALVGEQAVSGFAPSLTTRLRQHSLSGWQQAVLCGACGVMLIGLGMFVEARREAVASFLVLDTAPLCSISAGNEGYLLLVSLVQKGADSAQYPSGFGLRLGDLQDGRDVTPCADRGMLAPLMDATGG